MNNDNANRPIDTPEEMKDDARRMPIDPSNTSQIGQNAGIGVVGVKEHFTEQDDSWEDNLQNREQLFEGQAENYLKNPSPEEFNHEVDPSDSSAETKDDARKEF